MESFDSLLKKRVITGVKFDKDKYFIEKTFDEVVKDFFGVLGCKNLKSKGLKKGVLTVRVFKSVWSAELLLNKNKFIKQFNQRVGSDVIARIKILNK